MRIILSIAFGLITAAGFSQLIMNGNFETLNGTPPGNGGNVSFATGWTNGCATVPEGPGTPDIISNYTTTQYASIPLSGRIAQRGSISSNRVFIGMAGFPPSATNPPGYGESIIGTITEPLSDQYEYTVGLWDAIWSHPNIPAQQARIEIVLRKPNDCVSGKLVYTSGVLPVQNHGDVGVVTSNWNFVSGTFILTAADVAEGYTRMEIRFNGYTNMMRAAIDDVSLTKRKLPKADFTFVTIGQTYTTLATPYGPEELTQVCASPSPAITPVLINGGASSNETGYGIEITPITVNTNTYSISGPSIYNAWISTTGEVPTTDINVNNLPGMTTHMQVGQIYLVSLFVGDFPQHRKTRLFRINPLPTINAGVDATYCSADGVNITTSNWPVQVHKTGGILVGTYSSNPIMLPTATSNTYTFTTTNAFGCGAQDNAVLTMKLCSRASFFYKNPIGTTIINGNVFSEICSPYKIDGSASTNENAYHFRIQQYDPYLNQTVGPVLYENWYGSGSVGNDIALANVLATVPTSFVYNNYYLVGLSVGPDWHTDFKFFKAIDCTKSGTAELEEETPEQQDIEVFPNPNDGVFAVSFDNQTVQYLEVMDPAGKSVFATDVPNDATAVNIDLHDLTNGVYMVNIHHTNGEITVKKIIKN